MRADRRWPSTNIPSFVTDPTINPGRRRKRSTLPPQHHFQDPYTQQMPYYMPGMNPYTPQMALVCLPPMMIPQQPRYPSKIRSKAFQSRHSYQPNNQGFPMTYPSQYYSAYPEEDDVSSENDDEGEYEYNQISLTIKNQRFKSLATMSRLQNQAVRLIQREYRNYRKRRYYRRRRYEQNMQHAKAFLMDFVKEELVHHIVPESLLEVLKEQKEQALQKMTSALSPHLFVLSSHSSSQPNPRAISEYEAMQLISEITDDAMRESLHHCLAEVVQITIDGMIREYMLEKIDLERAALPPENAIAQDITNDYVKELLGEVIPLAIEELISEYFQVRERENCLDTMITDIFSEIFEEEYVIQKVDQLVQDVVYNCSCDASALNGSSI